MLKLKIKNFGPITTGVEGDGWLDLKKINVFIGPSGSGKSTVARLVYAMSKYETNFMRRRLETDTSSEPIILTGSLEKLSAFVLDQFDFNGFLTDESQMAISTDLFSCDYDSKSDKLVVKTNAATIKQIKLYIPSKRETSLDKSINDSSDAIDRQYASMLNDAKRELGNKSLYLTLSGKDVSYLYDQSSDTDTVIVNGSQIGIETAASGLKSTLPIHLLLSHLNTELERLNTNASEIDPNGLNPISNSRFLALEALLYKGVLEKRYLKQGFDLSYSKRQAGLDIIPSGFLAVIDEPELSLFPENQRDLVHYLIEAVKVHDKNMLILPTHSPYLVHYIGLATKAYSVVEKLRQAGKLTDEALAKINSIVPEQAHISIDDVKIYSFEDGAIKELPPVNETIPDDFSLNQELEKLGDSYYQLIELLYKD